jgi:hypothetical protein
MNKRELLKASLFILIFLALVFILISIRSKVPENKEIYCTINQRNATVCMSLYAPVCGYVQVECITTPCDPVQETFPNSCVACLNENVLYYMGGECNEES